MIGEHADPIAELFAPARTCEPTAEELTLATAVVAQCIPRRSRGLRARVAVWTAVVIAAAGTAFVALDARAATVGREVQRVHASPGAVAITAPLSFAAAAALEQTLRSARRHGSGRHASSGAGAGVHRARRHGFRADVSTGSARRGACARAPGRPIAARCPARAAPVPAAHPA